jgi:endogenous inhibitor of DNA gyrase (YacG/DUF329 family)
MAKLKPCPDCGHEVSTKAYSCPSCGRALKRTPGSRAAQGCAGFIAMVIGVLILIALAGVLSHG